MVLEPILEQLSSNDYFGFKCYLLIFASQELPSFLDLYKVDKSTAGGFDYSPELLGMSSTFHENAFLFKKASLAIKKHWFFIIVFEQLLHVDGQSNLYKKRLKQDFNKIYGFLFSGKNDEIVKYIQNLSEYTILGHVITILGLGIFQLSDKEAEFLFHVFSIQNAKEQQASLLYEILNIVLSLFESFEFYEGFGKDRTLLDNSLRFFVPKNYGIFIHCS